jgi:NADH-quinone oxidoreductase subunit L
MTAICILLFIGAMGKSAQVPLHVWLPDSMEGPTPISALIHAATMVTAGIFMVARMSPLFELSDTALSFVIVIGSITALFMGFLGIIQNDIKRVVAYSTLSQLGYMTVALGASAYSVAIFHLMTHAFFKALLFLAAGSVIIGMHHDQDIRNMGGLRKYMPITWITSLIGSLALIGTPFLCRLLLQGLDHRSGGPVAHPRRRFCLFCVMAGVFRHRFSTRSACISWSFMARSASARQHPMTIMPRTAKQLIMRPTTTHLTDADHAHPADDAHVEHHGLAPGQKPHETPWVVTLPLILLAIPSVVIGYIGDRADAVWRLLQGRNFHRCQGASGRRGACASFPRCFRHGDTRSHHRWSSGWPSSVWLWPGFCT